MASPPLSDLLGPVMAAVGLPLWIGPEEVTKNVAPPRIVWVPSVDLEFEGGVVRGRSRKTTDSVWSGFDVHCWGADYDAARELRRALLVALHNHVDGSYRLVRSEWLAWQEQRYEGRGRIWIVRLAIAEPMTDEPWTFVLPTAVDVAPFPGAASGDGYLDPIEP